MSELNFVVLATETAEAYRAGAPDANGQPPERHISERKDRNFLPRCAP